MSDATLPPPPCCSSEPPAAADGNRSCSSAGNGDTGTSLIEAESLSAKEEGSGEVEGEGKADSKQKRKRTRYVSWRSAIVWLLVHISLRAIYPTDQLDLSVCYRSFANVSLSLVPKTKPL